MFTLAPLKGLRISVDVGGRSKHISGVRLYPWPLTPSVPLQRETCQKRAIAWVGVVRPEMRPLAGRAWALVTSVVGAVRRIEKNMAGWLDVRYLAKNKKQKKTEICLLVIYLAKMHCDWQLYTTMRFFVRTEVFGLKDLTPCGCRSQ